MNALPLVLGIVLALIIAILDSIVSARQSPETAASLPGGTVNFSAVERSSDVPEAVEETMSVPGYSHHPKQFTIPFSDGRSAPAMIIKPDGDPNEVIKAFGLLTPRPTIFITGGASGMTPDDIALTEEIVSDGISAFAEENNITVIDGGTEAGVMKMIGDSRSSHGYSFPLIGICPISKVSYPGYKNPNEEATLEDGHSHFVLIDAENWGDESLMIARLTRAIAHGMPMIGILINGGKIAEKDVYLATAQGENKIPILVLDGSGRTATSIATAFKTGQAANSIIKAIIAGGDIRLTAIGDGKDSMVRKLRNHFGV